MIILDAIAQTVMERCDILAHYSEDTDRLTRRFATSPMRQVNDIMAAWMLAAGMTVHHDCVGNIIGRYEALGTDAGTMLFGSHLDTVCAAGKYDGTLGVLVPLACVERLHEQGRHLPFAIEILGFADEEGLRYHTTYLGSRAVAGIFDPAILQFVDDNNISMADAIRRFGGQPDPDLLRTARWQRDELLGYCEVHIEQGPVLEAQNLPVGIVSSISGQHRYALSFRGNAGHAGTVPMEMRHDALCAAAEYILAVETLARNTVGLVATVGQLQVLPGASNVIPGSVSASLDVRHQDDMVLAEACKNLYQQAMSIGQERRVTVDWQCIQEHKTIFCAPHLSLFLARAIEEEHLPVYALASGAGHDAVALSELTDVAMLFVRCKGGVSHHPDESIKTEDVAVSIRVVEHFLDHLCSMGG
ncbi:allantoate amidohydrolase [Dictyobacter kobayashii]|uniref:Zn-dependent hydrolase n=1 Tax=Dictyobacter kobayashii TaxID=2014872 RepID=A0A402AXP7_9CHLR|nr:allantoate amidohydrolase [Dictyobacter kobayashii]GCE23886.1 Zn-dependent hydrolase [Dictyobacter kobayashii]